MRLHQVLKSRGFAHSAFVSVVRKRNSEFMAEFSFVLILGANGP